MQLKAAGLWPLQPTIKYIEDVFSTYLYSGTDGTQTITNGIDLSTNGGLVWVKGRNETFYHRLASSPGPTLPNYLASNASDAASSGNGTISAFTTTGFTVSAGGGGTNTSGYNYVSWTFREQPKFFDVVTYTGNGVAGRTVSHNLGSAPGFIVCKRTDTADEWFCYHRSLGASQQILLNSTGQSGTNNNQWNNTAPTSSVFSLGTDSGANGNGGSYVAYLFAHDAGGFGLNGTDNVISCGSYTGTGASGNTITLGYEPQWLLIKNAVYSGTSDLPNWIIIDYMRGMSNVASTRLYPNTTAQDDISTSNVFVPTATGFVINGSGRWENQSGATYIYVAIRRGQMAVPTVGTSVFQPITVSSSATVETSTATFPFDMQFNTFASTNFTTYNNQINDRLRRIGFSPSFTTTPHLTTASTAAESTTDSYLAFKANGMDVTKSDGWGTVTAVFYNFRRATGFFDEVCWTGNNGSNQRVSHNLGVAPELIIYKGRNKVNYWRVYFGSINTYIQLDAGIAAVSGSNLWGSSAPTTTDFGINCGSMDLDNFNAVAYLFATCAGVSKVGSYTGTGAAQTINCGFTAGARFVLIKRTDSTGDWYVWDSASGIIPSNDPYLLLNSTAAQVTGTDYVDTTNVGFDITSTAPAAINANGGNFIFLAIA
jgi:hypothetical protein